MNREQLADLLRYSSPKSILVVTHENKLIELYCPFWIIVKNDLGRLKPGIKAPVEQVKLSPDLITVFVIANTTYYYWHFEILIRQ